MIDKITGNIELANGIVLTKDTRLEEFMKEPLLKFVSASTLERMKVEEDVDVVILNPIRYLD